MQIAPQWNLPPWEVLAARDDPVRRAWFWRQVEWNKAQQPKKKLR